MGVTIEDAEAVVESSVFVDADDRWNPRYTGHIGDLRVRVVVALDDPELIVTIHERRN
jgi:hypothetical protein